MTYSNDWWRKAVIYQIYPKSFFDTNGDGCGDIKGIYQKLDYLADLGVDALWISPMYTSPMKDNGYDISDYYRIDPLFGTNEELYQLISAAHSKKIKIIMDFVANHTSDQHQWFLESQQSKDNPYSDFYIWKDPKPDGSEPNNWGSHFGGSAWEYCSVRNQYYLHYYAKEQPDLNWENEGVRQAIYQAMRFWAEKGIDGWRMDVITEISKYTDFPDYETNSEIPVVGFMHSNGPRLHEFIQEMHREVFEPYGLMTVGEAQDSDAQMAQMFLDRERKELDMMFTFEHMDVDVEPDTPNRKWQLQAFNLPKLKRVFADWQTSLVNVGWNALYFENHDRPRIISRWGNDTDYRYESATAFATILHGQKGTPFIYQGEEIGMTNIKLPLSEYDDVEISNNYQELVEKNQTLSHKEFIAAVYQIGRDNARTPMQWNRQENAEFTNGTPWFPVNQRYLEINVSCDQVDRQSISEYYKQLIYLRHTEAILTEGSFVLLLEKDEKIFAFERTLENETWLILANLSAETLEFPPSLRREHSRRIIQNYPEANQTVLRPYESTIISYQNK
ncbi:alpha-glucosidase [Enterococcus devriesei]|uniref:glycoside hydrolase family 13 protein n=1 Tax=Enterococcus devriesei TaxID=319970 RepID=UPI0036D35888